MSEILEKKCIAVVFTFIAVGIVFIIYHQITGGIILVSSGGLGLIITACGDGIISAIKKFGK